MIGNRNAGVVQELARMNDGIEALPSSDPQLIADAIIRMHTGYSRYKQAALDAREAILSEFSWERHAERYREALREFVQ